MQDRSDDFMYGVDPVQPKSTLFMAAVALKTLVAGAATGAPAAR